MPRLFFSVLFLCVLHAASSQDSRRRGALRHSHVLNKSTAAEVKGASLSPAHAKTREFRPQRRRLNDVTTTSRVLLQATDEESVTDEEVECGIPAVETDGYLDANTRTWRITDTVLDDIEHDLQRIVDCTEEGDTILFDVTGMIQIASRMTIRRPLTLTAAIDDRELIDGVFPEAPSQATIVCPQENEGAFLIKARSVTIANLAFERCAFEGDEEPGAIIEVEQCSSRRAKDSIQLHHVGFRRNRMIDGVGLRVNAPSCAELEMINVEFLDNTCSGTCGAVLAEQTTLRDVSIGYNTFSRGDGVKPAIFYAGFGSNTFARDISVFENECAAFYVQEGFLTVTNGSFSRNNVGDGEVGGCFHLEDAGLTVEDSEFRKNQAGLGGVILGVESDVILTRSSFEENAATKGGVLHLDKDTSLSIQLCDFALNTAEEDGGVLFASDTDVQIGNSSLTDNSADRRGGCFYLERFSELELADASLRRNSARDGGALAVTDLSNGNVADCAFIKNSADESGGSCVIDEADLTLRFCTFTEGRALSGGYIHAKRSSVDLGNLTFSSGTARDGGAIHALQLSRLRVQDVVLESNAARRDGGAVYMAENCTANVTETHCHSNSAKRDGGFLYAGEASTLNMRHCSVSDQRASKGGGVVMGQGGSDIRMRNITFRKNTADSGGVAVLQSGSSGNFTNCSFSRNSAVTSGGVMHVEDSSLNIDRCSFSASNAERAGFIFSSESMTRVSDSDFRKGTSDDGGCFYVQNAGSFAGRNITLDRCKAESNGGAIYVNEGPQLDMQLSSVFASSAGKSGGAIFSRQASSVIQDSTFEESTASDFGGCIYATLPGSLHVSYSTIKETSASDGGAVAIERNVTATVEESSFLRSTATGRGGSWFIEEADASFSDSEFVNGVADVGGLVYAANRSSVEIVHSEFVNGVGEEGGCFLAEVKTEVRLESVELDECQAARIGGGIVLRMTAKADMENVRFSQAGANASGGAVFCSESELSADRLVIEESAAGVRGGALYAASSSTVRIKKSTIHNTSAIFGGATMLEAAVSGVFENTQFTENVAEGSGGVSYLDRSSLEIVDSRLEQSEAQDGGCVYARRSTLNIRNSTLNGSTARFSGGFVVAESGSSVVLRDATLTEGSAQNGGAIVLQSSTLNAHRLHISKSKARVNGGAIFAANVSTLLCAACTLEDNAAEEKGGAIYFESTTPQLLALQLDKSTIQRNVADQGGGLYFSSNNRTKGCSDPGATCTFAALSDTQLLKNEAASVGGAIFSNELSAVRVDCAALSNRFRSELYTREEWEAMNSLTSTKDICSSWKGNRAATYGSAVASYIRTIRKSIRYEDKNKTVDVLGNHHDIRNQQSGTHLPVIMLQATDEFDQGPAISASNETIEAVVKSPDGFFVGSIHLSLANGEAVISGIAEFATPGTYQILIEFSEEEMETFVLEVHIRDCVIGEVLTADGMYCQKCSAATYNFVPDDERGCRPCPEKGKCENSVIMPQKGYWHQTPCSTHLQRCTRSKACDFKERDGLVAKIGDAVDTCEIDSEQLEQYANAQCRKGQNGPLCGSCEAGHGRSQSSLCENCVIGFGNVMLVLLSSLIFLILCCFTVRSNVISFSSVIRREQVPTSPSEGPSTSNNLSPADVSDVKVWFNDGVSKSQRPLRQQASRSTAQTVNAPELAKWKAVEMFKIILNYLQMIAVAVSINVDWSVTLANLFEAAGFVSGMTTEKTHRSVECLASEGAAVERSVVSVLIDLTLPLIVIVLFVIFWALAMVRYKETVIYLLKKVVLSATAVFYISFLSITKTLINILNCVEVHDSTDFTNDSTTDYWAMDTSIKCYEGSHIVLAFALGWPFLILFTLGFPITLTCAIVRNVKDDYQKGWIYDTSGFTYRAYKKRFIYWDSVILLRKAVLAAVVVFSYPLGPNLQAVLSVFVLGLSLYSQALCRPFRVECEVLNEMEGISILASLLTFVSSLFFNDERVSDGVQIFVTVGVALCNLGLFLFFTAFFLSLSAKYLRTVLDREEVAYDSDGEAYHILKVYFVDHVFGIIRGAAGRCGKRISRTINRRSET